MLGVSEITDINGKPIEDENRLKRAAASLFFDSKSKIEDERYVSDALPAYYVAVMVGHLHERGELNDNDLDQLKAFLFAENILLEENNTTTLTTLEEQIELWSQTEGFLPPGGLSEYYNELIMPLSKKWLTEIYIAGDPSG